MIKITIETEEEIIGLRDKNAFDLNDAISMFDTILKKLYWVSPQSQLKLTNNLPVEHIKERVEVEGM